MKRFQSGSNTFNSMHPLREVVFEAALWPRRHFVWPWGKKLSEKGKFILFFFLKKKVRSWKKPTLKSSISALCGSLLP